MGMRLIVGFFFSSFFFLPFLSDLCIYMGGERESGKDSSGGIF